MQNRTTNRQRFEDLWNLKTAWFEPPNERRGGWSGVVKYLLPTDDGDLSVFIKRQENHLTRTWHHFIRGIPTFQKEFRNIRRLSRKHIPTIEAVYFGKSAKRAILITKALEGYQGLDQIQPNSLTFHQRQQLLASVADVIQRLHANHYQHNCLYPKHIFIKPTEHGWKVRLIDLEKLKRRLFKHTVMLRDLSSLARYTDKAWSRTDRLRFFKLYLGVAKLSAKDKKQCRAIFQLAASKRR